MVKQKDWKKLSWTTNITEAVTSPTKSNRKNVMTISGVAISASCSRNGVCYEASELASSAITLKGKPLMLNHSGKIEDICGRVTSSVWNSFTQSIEFTATIMEPKIQEMINDGRITDVSIGAKVNDLKENKDGTTTAKGIEFLELSLVAIPGIVDQGITSINQAIERSLVLKEKLLGKAKFLKESQELDVDALNKLKQDVDDLSVKVLDNSKIKLIEVRL